MKRISIFLLLVLICSAAAWSQQAVALKQKSLARWDIAPAHFSGITPLGDNRYAVVSDKEAADGFFLFRIEQDSVSGQVTAVVSEGFQGTSAPRVDKGGLSMRDSEGIVFHKQRNSVFISGEGDQQILEYALDGRPTGASLQIPQLYSKSHIVSNYGFEALTYQPATHRFWTTTESTLPEDGEAAGPAHPGAVNLLRLQAFDEDLQPCAAYAYRMDAGRTKGFGRLYAYGVPELTALPDGRLLVLEREVNISKRYLRSEVVCKLFVVNPAEGWQIDSSTNLKQLDRNKFLVKTLLARFVTKLNPLRYTLANYEGMCLGRTLADGRQTLLLVNDSQGRMGKGGIYLKDYLKVLILP